MPVSLTSSATSPFGSVGSWCPRVDALAAASRSAVCSRSPASSARALPGCCPSSGASCSVRDQVSGTGPLIGHLLHSAVSKTRSHEMGSLLRPAVSETKCQGWPSAASCSLRKVNVRDLAACCQQGSGVLVLLFGCDANIGEGDCTAWCQQQSEC